ncbi:MAG: 50S ribosomal protein L10 [Deltaproteobacteria bacterium]|nr:50S ribosomal protein L10 [Deltaproteobacteria bacterium]
MNKEKKGQLITELHEKFKRGKAAFIAEYRGLNAEQIARLRRQLKDTSGEIKVAKNTLARLALKGTDKESLTGFFDGPTAIALSYDNPVATANVLTRFIKDQSGLRLRGGILGDRVVSLEEIRALSELPSRDVLLGRLIGVIKGIPGGLVGVLSGIPRKFLGTIEAVKAKRQ